MVSLPAHVSEVPTMVAIVSSHSFSSPVQDQMATLVLIFCLQRHRIRCELF